MNSFLPLLFLLLGFTFPGAAQTQRVEIPTVTVAPAPGAPVDSPHVHQVDLASAPATIPYYGSVLSYQGSSYHTVLVGGTPAQNAITSIPVVVIPLKFVFSYGVADGTRWLSPALASPIFQYAPFRPGTTQYGDAIQRTNWNWYVQNGSPDWHTLLGPVQYTSTVTINVPAGKGGLYKFPSGGIGGLVDDTFLTDAMLLSIVQHFGISPKTLTIFLSDTTALYHQTVGTQYTLGYHTAMQSGSSLYTFIYSAYSLPGIFSGAADVESLSHEVAEWMDDPFLTNAVPRWTVGNGYGCDDLLEVGDPLVGVTFTKYLNGRTYHLQDVALLPWFTRSSPSFAYGGLYTYLGTFHTFSQGC